MLTMETPHPTEVVVDGWTRVCALDDIPVGSGICVRIGVKQAAVFRLSESEVRSVQNICPHQGVPVMHQGIVGDAHGEPKVACPLHKRTYSLVDGRNLSGEGGKLRRFLVLLDEGFVWLRED